MCAGSLESRGRRELLEVRSLRLGQRKRCVLVGGHALLARAVIWSAPIGRALARNVSAPLIISTPRRDLHSDRARGCQHAE